MTNRIIKFRAWSKLLNCMSEILELDFEHDAIRCIPGHLPKNKLSDCILMQFTGLTDKNGKEIYEGDILKGISEEARIMGNLMLISGMVGRVGVVKFIDGGWTWSNPSCEEAILTAWGSSHKKGPILDQVEVIGNIYENPELLK